VLVTCHGIRLPQPVQPPPSTWQSTTSSSDTQFTAYAFSDQQIKSDTSIYPLTRPWSSTKPTKPNAFILTIGVSANDNCVLDVQDAAADAGDTALTISKELAETDQFSNITSVELISGPVGTGDCYNNQESKVRGRILRDATKQNIQDVFAVLGGESQTKLPRRLWCGNASYPHCSRKLKQSQPDDVVFVFFSGHGERDDAGGFYLIPSDTGHVDSVRDESGHIRPEILKRSISSDELRSWIRNVDSASISLIIDACHSAAAVQSKDFKPGPMGSRDLGELAFAKGMRVLAGSQSEGLAIDEALHIKHGLLTYALLKDGIEDRGAESVDNKGRVRLTDLFNYAVIDVPDLYRYYVKGSAVQVPRLFDFEPNGFDPVVSLSPSQLIEVQGFKDVKLGMPQAGVLLALGRCCAATRSVVPQEWRITDKNGHLLGSVDFVAGRVIRVSSEEWHESLTASDLTSFVIDDVRHHCGPAFTGYILAFNTRGQGDSLKTDGSFNLSCGSHSISVQVLSDKVVVIRYLDEENR
jgi:hypothetical protein